MLNSSLDDLLDFIGKGVCTNIGSKRNNMLNTIFNTVISGNFKIFIELFAVITNSFDGFTSSSSKYTVFTPSELAGFVESASNFKFGVTYGEVSFDGRWVVVDGPTIEGGTTS